MNVILIGIKYEGTHTETLDETKERNEYQFIKEKYNYSLKVCMYTCTYIEIVTWQDLKVSK